MLVVLTKMVYIKETGIVIWLVRPKRQAVADPLCRRLNMSS